MAYSRRTQELLHQRPCRALAKGSRTVPGQICSVIDSEGLLGCGSVFVMNSALIAARYPFEKGPEMHCGTVRHEPRIHYFLNHVRLAWPLRLVLPTPEGPMTTNLGEEDAHGVLSCVCLYTE